MGRAITAGLAGHYGWPSSSPGAWRGGCYWPPAHQSDPELSGAARNIETTNVPYCSHRKQ